MRKTNDAAQVMRREFLGWLCKIGGGATAFTLTSGIAPLRKINTTLFGSPAHAQSACTEDTCTTRDNCDGDTEGHTCQVRDVCDEDGSGDCTNDECTADSSLACENDVCVSDSSGACTGDRCTSDSSGACTNDGGPACPEDESCTEDYTGCRDDFSGVCSSDSSGDCTNDSCVADSSGDCTSDICKSDSSGSCQTDFCVADSSQPGDHDDCISDSSGECTIDYCTSDSSGGCTTDNCIADSSAGCTNDQCTSDSSGGCPSDTCISDSSGDCAADRCNADASGECTVADVCILDASSSCGSDLCREDRTPLGSECTSSDTCSLDLAMDSLTSRRRFARAGVNKALKLLYRISAILIFLGITYGQSQAQTVIDATNAILFPAPAYVTSGSVSVPSPVGPFLRDCDEDGVLEADVNGDGLCDGDPEVLDYNSDGSRELPPGTTFSGDFQFTCFHIPDDVAITATGPLAIRASMEVAVFGAVRLPAGAQIASLSPIDIHTSTWLSEGAGVSFTTALAGDVDETQTVLEGDSVPPVTFTSICSAALAMIPTLSEWGVILFALLLTGVGYWTLRRGKKAA